MAKIVLRPDCERLRRPSFVFCLSSKHASAGSPVAVCSRECRVFCNIRDSPACDNSGPHAPRPDKSRTDDCAPNAVRAGKIGTPKSSHNSSCQVFSASSHGTKRVSVPPAIVMIEMPTEGQTKSGKLQLLILLAALHPLPVACCACKALRLEFLVATSRSRKGFQTFHLRTAWPETKGSPIRRSIAESKSKPAGHASSVPLSTAFRSTLGRPPLRFFSCRGSKGCIHSQRSSSSCQEQRVRRFFAIKTPAC